jgi:membrane fusion protein (multidrug efflux system)
VNKSGTSEAPPADASAAGAPRNGNGRRRGRHLRIAAGILAVAALVIAGYWFFVLRGFVFTDDARLGGHLVDLAPEITGRVTAVLFHEGQAVRSGEDVFRLDPTNAQAALSQAKATLLSAKANLAAATAKFEKTRNGNRPEEIRAAEATLKRLTNEEELARLCLERTQALAQEGSAAKDELDRAKTAYESARQSRESARQTFALLQQGSRQEDIDAARADVELAQSRVAEAGAGLETAQADLAHCCVKAPFDGWVVRRWLDAGAITPPSQPVVSLFDPATLRVDANIEEKYLHEVRVGDEAEIRVDAFPALRLKGRVTEILRATNSQFSLIPAEGVSGTFIKVTQRVPLRIAVSAPPDLPLGPGMSVVVKIRIGSAPAEKPAVHARE